MRRSLKDRGHHFMRTRGKARAGVNFVTNSDRRAQRAFLAGRPNTPPRPLGVFRVQF